MNFSICFQCWRKCQFWGQHVGIFKIALQKSNKILLVFRISLEFRAKLLTDQEVSEVNFSSTTENRVLYIVGIAQDEREMIKILDHASNIAGVKKIVNLIIKKNDPKRKK